MGRAIQAQCKKLSDIHISDFHAKDFDSNSVSALLDFSAPDGFTEALKSVSYTHLTLPTLYSV